MYRKASKIRDKEMNREHKRRKMQKRKSPFSFERTGARLVARAYVEIKRMNTFPAYRVQLYIENDWQVRDERAIHSVIKLLAKSPHSHPRLNVLNTG